MLVRWLFEVPPDAISKALDMACVTWQGSRRAYNLVSTDTTYGPAYLQASKTASSSRALWSEVEHCACLLRAVKGLIWHL